jgi:hypothetical protein
MTIQVSNSSGRVLRPTHLWCEPKDDQSTPIVFRNFILILFAQQFRNRELPSFDPKPRRLANGLERQKSAIRGADYPSRILGLVDGASVLFELTAEELIERLERPKRVAHFV